MKTVQTTLYRFDELKPEYHTQAKVEYELSFLSRTMPISEIWFTSTGLIYPIFNV
ncbi:MAG TPA: hypothetical protein VN922_17055 [Bacteroidia bacterium]|nr:hypothetical protein [Bacteroidia bacterium]